MQKKSFIVDQLYSAAKLKCDFNKNHFSNLCQILLKLSGSQTQVLQISQYRYDSSNLYTVRGLPMSRSVMRIFLQRINYQYLAAPKFKRFSDKPILMPPFSLLSPYLRGANLNQLCLYDIKLSATDFAALKEFESLQKLILWPEAITWNCYPKEILLAAFDKWKHMKTMKLFTLSPELLPHLPLSISNLTIYIVKTVTSIDDEETKQLFQSNLHQFIMVHPHLKKLTVLIRPRHLNYFHLIDHLSTNVDKLQSFKCQYNFKHQPLELSCLKFLRHFGIQQNFFIGYELDTYKTVVSSNIAKTLFSNPNLTKLTLKNCYFKNSRSLCDYLNLFNGITDLHLINIFGSNNELLNSLFTMCQNLRCIVLTNVTPFTTDLLSVIGQNCKMLTKFLLTVDEDDEIVLTKVISDINNLITVIFQDAEMRHSLTSLTVKVTDRQGRQIYRGI